MNKKIKVFLACSLLIVLSCCFAGCKNLNTTLEDTVSEIHQKVFYAQDDNFFVQVTSGQIEKNYALDGQKNQLENFVTIKVVAQNSYEKIYADFSLQNTKYSQLLVQSPVDDKTWTATVNDEIVSESMALSVLADETKVDYQLTKVQTCDTKPLDVLKQTFEKELMDCFDGKTFLCETTIRMVKSPDQNDNRYFWYVVVYKQDKNFFGLMADVTTGQVVAKKG